MEITLNVNVNAPELAAALITLASAFGNTTAIVSESSKVTKENQSQAEKPRSTKADNETKKPDVIEDKHQQEGNKPTETPKQDDTSTSDKKQISLEDVRAKLAELTRAGKPVKELINKYGASKLSEIPPEKFAEVLKEAEGL